MNDSNIINLFKALHQVGSDLMHQGVYEGDSLYLADAILNAIVKEPGTKKNPVLKALEDYYGEEIEVQVAVLSEKYLEREEQYSDREAYSDESYKAYRSDCDAILKEVETLLNIDLQVVEEEGGGEGGAEYTSVVFLDKIENRYYSYHGYYYSYDGYNMQLDSIREVKPEQKVITVYVAI